MRQKDKIKVLMTAGHAATTAFSLFEKIREKRKGWDVVWVGTKKAIEGSSATTLEHKIFSSLKIKNFSISSGRLQRRLTIWTIPSLLKIPFGFFQSLSILIRERPDVIVSFGGHVSIPVAVAGCILGIPVVVHEQTAAAGLANKVVGIFAKKVAVSRRTSFDYFPKNKTLLVGNLVRTEILGIKPKESIGNPPVLYITGGSRGSQILNDAVSDILFSLIPGYLVIHQAGDTDLEKFKEIEKSIPESLRKYYMVKASFGTEEVVEIFKKADIVVGRAGANTVSEIIVTRKPSILVPIPWSQENEQMKNAQLAADSGLSTILIEDELTGEKLLEKINYIRENWNSISKNSDRTLEDLDRSASDRMLNVIEDSLR